MTGIELFTVAGTAVTLGDAALAASTLIGAAGAIQQGQAQKAYGQAQYNTAVQAQKMAENRAQAMERQAGQERASSQRAAIEDRRQSRLATSRIQAVSAAGGGGALDPTITDITGDVMRQGDIAAMTSLYEGGERAKSLEYGAALERAGGQGELYAGQVARAMGNAAASRSYLTAGGNILAGYAGLEERWAKRAARNTLLESEGGSSLYRRYGSDPIYDSDYW